MPLNSNVCQNKGFRRRRRKRQETKEREAKNGLRRPQDFYGQVNLMRGTCMKIDGPNERKNLGLNLSQKFNLFRIHAQFHVFTASSCSTYGTPLLKKSRGDSGLVFSSHGRKRGSCKRIHGAGKGKPCREEGGLFLIFAEKKFKGSGLELESKWFHKLININCKTLNSNLSNS